MKAYIPRGVLELILHASRSSYPNEFGALIRGRIEGGGSGEATESREPVAHIKELIMIPGTVQGSRHVIYHLNMLPIQSGTIGSVHSHPGGSNRPSDADLKFFDRVGPVNLIVKYPYESVADVALYPNDADLMVLEE